MTTEHQRQAHRAAVAAHLEAARRSREWLEAEASVFGTPDVADVTQCFSYIGDASRKYAAAVSRAAFALDPDSRRYRVPGLTDGESLGQIVKQAVDAEEPHEYAEERHEWAAHIHEHRAEHL